MRTKKATATMAEPSTTFDGIYERSNLESNGSVPARPPYDLCPDIIQSTTAVSDPQETFGSDESWRESYNVAPAPGQKNYYYVRGKNGATEPVRANVSLYYADAPLLMVPSAWQNNPLKTSRGKASVAVEAEPGQIVVTPEPLLFNQPPALASGHYYAFVSHASDVPDVPKITDWLDLGRLLSRDIDFGFRSTSHVRADESEWYRRVILSIPSDFTSGEVLLTLSVNGFLHDTFGAIADLFTPDGRAILIEPTRVQSDPAVFGTRVILQPGYSATMTVQYWNTSGSWPAPGASITLEALYVVPPNELSRAAEAGLLDSARDQKVQHLFADSGPVRVAIVGSATFIVDEA